MRLKEVFKFDGIFGEPVVFFEIFIKEWEWKVAQINIGDRCARLACGFSRNFNQFFIVGMLASAACERQDIGSIGY